MGDFASSLEMLGTSQGIMSFLTLIVLEIVLGIDNLVFLSILVGKVPEDRQRFVRLMGLGLALVFRIILLMCISWLIGLTDPVVTIAQTDMSWRDLILLTGGIFLIYKSTAEIHSKILNKDHGPKEDNSAKKAVSMILVQIVAIDLIFSIDSILTAVGLTEEIAIMVLAVIASMVFMMVFAKSVGEFINRNPTVVILALAFLIMIGMLLIADSFHYHVPRGYVYFAMGFSFFVEVLNLRLLKNLRKKGKFTDDNS
jgi:predicted tellurium resistance membrane protein TerC